MAVSPQKDITILCKVVDNYGDIGFVYRLARALTSLDSTVSIRIVTDNLFSFSLLAPGLDPAKNVQQYGTWTVYDWNDSDTCTAAFTADQPHIILQCFQCGYPSWLETLLFTVKCRDTVHVINIDYLTAEPYADDFHCLASLTRSSSVKKVNFMPGFTAKTGGLILDGPFAGTASVPVPAQVQRLLDASSSDMRVLMFSYERDFSSIIYTLAQFPVHVYAASGRGRESFLSAWGKAKKPFPVTELPFLSQTEWDSFMCAMSFLFVRGEDSLSRACLSGIPFVWHAYPQKDEYQKVKVQALLDRMKPFFTESDFAVIKTYWLSYNTTGAAGDAGSLVELLARAPQLRAGFTSFADAVRSCGDFARHLLLYISQLS
jgi:uncharacterized repeat protein (TIGR03837 family)